MHTQCVLLVLQGWDEAKFWLRPEVSPAYNDRFDDRRLGRRPGHRPKSDRLASRVLEAVSEGRSYRWIARDLGISKNTVAAIVRRRREGA